MLVLGVIANDTEGIFGFDVNECPISHKFVPKFVGFINTPEEVVNRLIHAAVINFA